MNRRYVLVPYRHTCRRRAASLADVGEDKDKEKNKGILFIEVQLLENTKKKAR